MTGRSSSPTKVMISFFIRASLSLRTFADEFRVYFLMTSAVLN